MQKWFLVKFVFVLSLFCINGFAQTTSFDADLSPNVIVCSGNTNSAFVVKIDNYVQVSLRAKIAYQGDYNNDGTGIYFFKTGSHSKDNSAALWNLEFPVNVNLDGSTLKTLDDYNLTLSY